MQYQFFTEAVEEVLLCGESPLRCLEFDLSDYYHCAVDSVGNLRTLISAVGRQSNGLERLEIRGICYQSRIAANFFWEVLHVLPLLKVKHLTLNFWYDPQYLSDPSLPSSDILFPRLTLDRFLGALKNNYRIQSFYSNWGPDCDVLSFNREVDFWLERNRKLARWTKDPTEVPQYLWPTATKLALKAGKESLYLTLVAISKKEGGLRLHGSRKRKRPQNASRQQQKKYCK